MLSALNREMQQQYQTMLLQDGRGRLRFAPMIIRPALPLPPEILAEIFVHCLPDDSLATPDPTTAPLLLCRICRQFREVALTTPDLWTSLNVDLEQADGLQEEFRTDYIELCKSWLSRARTKPLLLGLQDDLGCCASLPLCLGIIVSVSSRWQFVDLELSLDTAKLLPQAGEFPLLEELNITAKDDLSCIPISFHAAPKLRRVFISDHGSVQHMQFLWHQLTEYQTWNISISCCFYVLRDATQIVDANFRRDWDEWDD
ncbi:hypothetical protein C8R43DRAFT_1233693 [Mycena crocata]|nr:hypothetical protein C8R43DRAFT_1233693 [Mycena crocata]